MTISATGAAHGRRAPLGRLRTPRFLCAGFVALAFAASPGCSRNPQLLAPNGNSAPGSLEAILAAQPLGSGENIRVTLLGRTEALSHHLVQIADRESPHRHVLHDLTVTLLRGEGDLHLGDQTVRMRAGDVAAVPRGTPHFFVNTRSPPAVAFVTFAPPYDGSDQVPVAP